MRLNINQRLEVENALHDADIDVDSQLVCEEIESEMKYCDINFEKAFKRVIKGWIEDKKLDEFVLSLGFSGEDLAEFQSILRKKGEVYECAEKTFVKEWKNLGGNINDVDRRFCWPWNEKEWRGWKKFLFDEEYNEPKTLREAAQEFLLESREKNRL